MASYRQVVAFSDGPAGASPAVADGEQFNLLNAPAIGGQFSWISLPLLSAGLSWDSSPLYSTGVMSVVPEPATVTLARLASARFR